MAANFTQAVKTAQQVLEKNSINSAPVPIVELAESYGLNLRSMDFGKFTNEISGYIDLDFKAIFVNENESQVRQAFTIAHELGHFLLHKNQIQENPELTIMLRQPLKHTEPDSFEQEANAFAAEILVPKEFLKQYLENGIKEISLLASVFGVSQEVITYRLHDEKSFS